MPKRDFNKLTVATGNSPLCIVHNLTGTENLWFPSASLYFPVSQGNLSK